MSYRIGCEECDEELAQLREENAKLLLRIANLDSDNIKERNALKEKVCDLEENLSKAAVDALSADGQYIELEAAARKLYKALQGTMAAQSPSGLALGALLRMDPTTGPTKK